MAFYSKEALSCENQKKTSEKKQNFGIQTVSQVNKYWNTQDDISEVRYDSSLAQWIFKLTKEYLTLLQLRQDC